MKIIEIDENTWRLEEEGVRFFLLKGSKKALLIDTGMNTKNARELAEGLTDLPIEVLNTHADPDHISGNGSFEAFYMSRMEEENFREHGGCGTLLPVSEGDILDLGERELEIVDIPGHTPGSIAIIDRKNRVLISGDSVQDGNIFMFQKRRDLAQLKKSLHHLLEFQQKFDTIYPSHGSFPCRPELIGQLIEGADEILSGKAKGKNIEIFGNPVCLYRFSYAGFLCDRVEE